MRAPVFAAFVAAAALLRGCASVEGGPPPVQGGSPCVQDLDCGPGRHCGGGACALDCTKDDDCGLLRPGEGLACSLCGRCAPPGQIDAACLAPTERPCASDLDCEASLGVGHGCGLLGLCAARCGAQVECGRGATCSAERGLCEEQCFSDGACYFRGFSRECRLPAGVDQAANQLAADPIVGQCAPRPGGLGFTAAGPGAPAAAAYQGVWGQLFVSAVRTEGLPVIGRTDTAAIQLQLVKAQASASDLQFTVRWCAARFLNFHEKDLPIQQLVQILVPERNVDAISVVSFFARGVPALAPGVTFSTEALLDLRGALLADPAADPLPTRFDLTRQRDQDRDGQPGMTSLSTGLVTGELYQAQRTSAVFQVQVVDEGHLHGLLTTRPEATILGASNPDLINDGQVIAHPQADRSYFRAIRLGDDATCEQVIALGAIEGGWLAYEPRFDASKRP